MRDAGSLQSDEYRELAVLEAVEGNPSVSQRELAQELGVAVGVVNAAVRTLARKGLIKVRGENNRSITYHLTHEGVLRKAALALAWTRNTLGFYRDARLNVTRQIELAAAEGHRDAVLYGANELAEIAVLVSGSAGVSFRYAITGAGIPIADQILGVPVSSDPDGPDADVDLVMVCEPVDDDALRRLRARFPAASLISLLGQPMEEGTD